MAGRNTLFQSKETAGLVEICMTKCIAVDRRIVGERNVARSRDLFGKHPLQAGFERLHLDIGNPGDTVLEDLKRFLMPEPLLVVQKTVVEEGPAGHATRLWISR